MLSSWDLIRPRTWHTHASMEQSMMELDPKAEQLHRQAFHHHHDENDDFFAELSVPRRDQPTDEQQQQPAPANNKHTFSSHSFSDSTVLDDEGQRMTSRRRRYEDSTGRFKAVHEHEIGDKKLRSVWNRKHKDEEGDREKTLVGGGDMDEFEAAWKQSAFGAAEAKHEATETLKDKEQTPALQ